MREECAEFGGGRGGTGGVWAEHAADGAVYETLSVAGNLVTHRYGLRDVDAAMKKAIDAESMKVVLEPWR